MKLAEDHFSHIALAGILLFAGLLIGLGYPSQPAQPTIITNPDVQDITAATESDDAVIVADRAITDNDKTIVTTNAPEVSFRQNAQSVPLPSPFIKEYVSNNTIITDSSGEYPLRTYTTQAVPNDPSYNQWWVNNASLPELWDTNTGSTDTVLAIIDTGVALDHEEFQGRWHTNVAEQGVTVIQGASLYNCTDQAVSLNRNCNLIDDNFDGIVDNESGTTTQENPSQLNCSDQALPLDKSCNRIDDDSNGLVDDWRGWDFMNFDNSTQAGQIDPEGSGVRHASYVTGVAAANANNGVGIAGANWQTKILPLQALGDGGSGTSVSVARAIRYAVDQGADVISMSLGSFAPDDFIRQTVQEALAAGVIVVAAAGNDGCECLSYPANYPEVVAVGALNTFSQRASFSSYGSNLDIMAPGTSLYTASWTPANQTSAYEGGIAGTSLATPIVSGVITSLIAQNPTASAIEIIAALTENTNRLSLGLTEPHNKTLGYGALNSFTANNRLITAYAPPQLTEITSVSLGATLSPSSPAEPTAATRFYQCDVPSFGTTPLYLVSKANSQFFTASRAEVYQAQQSGYTLQSFGLVCVMQGHDNPSEVRSINAFAEFQNILLKQ